MIKYLLILLFYGTGAIAHTKADEELLRITVKGKDGFINLQGKVVIKPQFKEAANFKEGFAVVRKGGTYGYINKTGKLVIPDVYDYAEDFNDGFAVVNFHQHAWLISKTGTIIKTQLKNITSFEQGRAIATTLTDKKGVIDTTGKLIIDTIFERIVKYKDVFLLGLTPIFMLPMSILKKKYLIEMEINWMLKNLH